LIAGQTTTILGDDSVVTPFTRRPTIELNEEELTDTTTIVPIHIHKPTRISAQNSEPSSTTTSVTNGYETRPILMTKNGVKVTIGYVTILNDVIISKTIFPQY
jgi:hypothetical protein